MSMAASTMLYQTPYTAEEQIGQSVPQSVPQPLTHPIPSSQPTVQEEYELIIRQQPERARVAGVKDKERKPIDPPPILQLRVSDDSEAAKNYLQSPYYFVCCSLYHASDDPQASNPVAPTGTLTGTLVSSLHRLKDVNNQDGGFFVFGDLSIRHEGEYKLLFDLFEMQGHNAVHLKSMFSSAFTVLAPKSFPGMAESTFLSKLFADQGVKLRIRKEPRTLLSTKRQYPQDEYTSPGPRSPKRPAMPHLQHHQNIQTAQNVPIYPGHHPLHTGHPGYASHPNQNHPGQQFPMSNGLVSAPWYGGR
ncbi:hypothetical protein FQN49_000170 [Arthroderma sp. PD_2]|nr:hypothetical protein FQN49_000170 [Arthroderma sp. PD_2]